MNTYPSTNNDQLVTGSKNNDKYNLRRNKRDYGRHIGKVDGADGFTFVHKDKDTIWSDDIYQHIVLPQLQSKTNSIFVHPAFDKGKEKTDTNTFNKIVDLIFAQMTATKGITLFGQRAVSVLFKKYKQFYDMDIFERVKVDDLYQLAKN